MNRRDFFAAGATVAGVLAAPGWLSRAFAQNDDSVHDLNLLSTAYRRAQRMGRPLLVFVVPDDGGMRNDRGHLFGELLNNGGESGWADLALAEVVCTSMATLRQLVPQAGNGEPLMIVVETDSVPGRVQRLDAQAPEWPNPWQEGITHEERVRQENAAIDQRVRILRDLVHGALAADAAMIDRRAQQARAHTDAGALARLEGALRNGSVSAELAAIAPAIVAQAIVQSPQHADRLRRTLAQVTEAALVRHAVPGSRWAIAGGCGVSFEEGTSQLQPPCGMGHVPERSRRMLYWWTS